MGGDLLVKKFLSFSLGLVLLLGLTIFFHDGNKAEAQGNENYRKGEVLVKFKDSATPQEIANTHKKMGGNVRETIPGINVQLVDIGNKNVGQAISEYVKSGLVEFVEPNFVAEALTTDVHFANQWGLENSGQKTCNTAGDICDTGTDDADVDAPEAWVLTQGSQGVVIAILDSGIDQDHEDFQIGKIVAQNDFTDTGTVDDLYGHGTHVAGIAAASTNNNLGVAGLGYNSSLMNVKVLDNNGYGAYSWIANGIIWATDNGAQVINMSLGASQRSSTLLSAVNYAWNNGSVIVAAAGNSNNPSRTYPAYYSNCIAVAATDNDDQKASFSSYGKWVDVAAPGENIYSTFPNHPFKIQSLYGRSNNYDFGSGTSMSTPFVSGLAALIWSTPEYGTNNSAVRAQIESTADPISGTGSYWTWGRINACNAVGGDCSVNDTPEDPSDPGGGEDPEQPEECRLYCFKGTCDGQCHPVKEDSSCPDCQ